MGGKIAISKLERYVQRCNNRTALCRAIMNSLLNEVESREGEEWEYFRRRSFLPTERMRNLALIKLRRIQGMSDIYVIDISVLRKKDKGRKLIERESWLGEYLGDEISLIIGGRK